MTKKKPEQDKLRPGPHPFYETAEKLQAKIAEYFDKGVTQREVLVGPANNRTTVLLPVPTITGLVLYCGFSDRASFYDYEKKPLFTNTIKRARTFIEKEYEEQLATGNPTGAIFALKNFGWTDKQEVEHSGDIIIDFKGGDKLRSEAEAAKVSPEPVKA